MKTRTFIRLLAGVFLLGGPVFAYAEADPNLSHIWTRQIIDYPTCGPAAVFMVLKMYGIAFHTSDVCDSTYIDDQRRSSVESLCNTLARYGVYARGCRVSFEDLLERTTPSILLSPNASGTNHFLICVGHDGNELNLIDPLFVPFRKLSKDMFQLSKQKVAILTQLTPFEEYEVRTNRLETLAMFSSMLVFLSTAVITYTRHMTSS